MGDGEAPESEVGEERLHVPQDRAAGGRIAVVADGHGARQPGDDVGRTEIVADVPQRPVIVEVLAVETDDPHRLLPPVLEGVQPQRRVGGGVGVAEDAEYAAFLVQAVVRGAIEGMGAREHLLLPLVAALD